MLQPASYMKRMLLTLALVVHSSALGHGSVTAEDDLCLINIGYLKAHFKIYLPQERGHQDFCEDLPESGEALFVMDYIHGDMANVAMDFRIIHNVTGLGRFAQVEDLNTIADLQSATVFYRPPSVESEVFTALHVFREPGEYLGIVTATRPDTGQSYAAVFPFEVGYSRIGYLPFFLLLAALTHLLFRFMNGRGAFPVLHVGGKRGSHR